MSNWDTSSLQWQMPRPSRGLMLLMGLLLTLWVGFAVALN